MSHNLLVRATHWINFLSFLALAVSGVAILVAHPRFYWGESGYFDTPAAFELPLTVNLDQTGWSRDLHFLAAWIAVTNGVIYLAWGLLSRHFRYRDYGGLQRLAYSSVILFGVVMVLSGLAIYKPVQLHFLTLLFGGYDGARVVHLGGLVLLAMFVVTHLILVASHPREIVKMITGGGRG